jgi:hypothetical protein
MWKFRSVVHLLLITGFLLVCMPLCADTLTIGLISFDNLVPAGPSAPGVNVFTLYDFTGSNALPPDAPVTTPLDFLDTAVTLDGSQVNNAGTITPGSTQAAVLEFSTSQNFTSATFSADLSSPTFVANGQSYLAASSVVTASLLPSSPPDLIAGVDFVPITIEASPVAATVPEPSSCCLTLPVLLAVLYRCRRNCTQKPGVEPSA